MPIKTKNGYVAPKPEDETYMVNKTEPSGVFVQNIRGGKTTLEYAGTGTATGECFVLPQNPDFLRDIAAAINAAADDIDSW